MKDIKNLISESGLLCNYKAEQNQVAYIFIFSLNLLQILDNIFVSVIFLHLHVFEIGYNYLCSLVDSVADPDPTKLGKLFFFVN